MYSLISNEEAELILKHALLMWAEVNSEEPSAPLFHGAFLQTEQEEATNTEKFLFSCYTCSAQVIQNICL